MFKSEVCSLFNLGNLHPVPNGKPGTPGKPGNITKNLINIMEK